MSKPPKRGHKSKPSTSLAAETALLRDLVHPPKRKYAKVAPSHPDAPTKRVYSGPPVDGSRISTSQIMRSPSEGEHKGAEVAKLLATGAMATRMRDRDACGPLRENVGLTTQAGGALDYVRQRSSRFEIVAHPKTLSGDRAKLIRAYRAERDAKNLPPTNPNTIIC